VPSNARNMFGRLRAYLTKVDLHLERLWSHNITLRTRLVDTVTTPMLLRTVVGIDDGKIIFDKGEIVPRGGLHIDQGLAVTSHAA
jgi:hypothetical protein